MIEILDKKFVPFLSEEEIQKRIIELADQISTDYQGKKPLLVSVLNGAFIFSADLLRKLKIPVEITFIRLSSYEELQSSGNVKELLGLRENIFNRNILLIEDIVDTGHTLAHLNLIFEGLGAKSIKIASLLHKPQAQVKANLPDYIGFQIPNKFVVGYGLDYNGLGRELSEIYQLAEI